MNPDENKSKKKRIRFEKSDALSSDSNIESGESPDDTVELSDVGDETIDEPIDDYDQDVSVDADKKPDKGGNLNEKKIEQLESDLATARNELLRERASFINYRRRTEEEKDLIRRYCAQDIAYDILTVLDYFEEGLKFTSENPDVVSLVQGVRFTVDEMHKLLSKHGIKEIPSDIPFDPRLHEAFGTQVTSDVPPDTIVKIHRKGYLYKDRVLRPAMVTVSKFPENVDKIIDEQLTNGNLKL